MLKLFLVQLFHFIFCITAPLEDGEIINDDNAGGDPEQEEEGEEEVEEEEEVEDDDDEGKCWQFIYFTN